MVGPQTQLENLSLVFHIVSIVALFGCFLFRAKMVITVKASFENIGFAFVTLFYVAVLTVQVLIEFKYVADTLSYCFLFWRMGAIAGTLFYLLVQIQVLAKFQRVLLFRPWIPSLLSVLSVIIHIVFCFPSYGAIWYHYWHLTGVWSLFPIIGGWLLWVVCLDFFISIVVLRIVISNLDPKLASNKHQVLLLKATLILMLLFDMAGIALNIISSFDFDYANINVQELGEMSFQALHLSFGQFYFARIVSLFTQNHSPPVAQVKQDESSYTVSYQ